MKKLIALMLVLVLVIATFAACSNNESSDSETDLKAKETTIKGEPVTDENAPSVDGDPVTDEDSDDSDAKNDRVDAENVVYDDNGITITVTGFKSGFMGPEVVLSIANTTDSNIFLSTDECIVNGITVGGMGYIDAPAGEVVEDSVSIYDMDLDSAGIEDIGTIIFQSAYILDSDSYETLYHTPFQVTVDPDVEQAIDTTGEVLYNDKGITVIAKVVEDDPHGETVYLLIQNETGKDITVDGMDILVNGTDVDAWLYDIIFADTVRYSDFCLSISSMAELGIDAVETVEFSLMFIDPDTYDMIAETETLTITVD